MCPELEHVELCTVKAVTTNVLCMYEIISTKTNAFISFKIHKRFSPKSSKGHGFAETVFFTSQTLSCPLLNTESYSKIQDNFTCALSCSSGKRSGGTTAMGVGSIFSNGGPVGKPTKKWRNFILPT